MGHGVVVNVTHSSLVKPASPSPQAFLELSPSDLMWRDYTYNRRLLFFQAPATTRAGDESHCHIDPYLLFISTLQSSLAKALAIFYPLAGRLVVVDKSDDAPRRLCVACNDEGVELVQARIHGVSFAELQSSNFDMQPYFVQLTRWAFYTRLQEGAPLFSLQVTRFSCGSMVLGIAHSHVIADGFSLWHFVSSWTECARGKPISLLPSLDRTPLMIKTASPEKAKVDWIPNVEGPDQKSYKVGIVDLAYSKVQHVFSFSKEMVEELKKRAHHGYGSYEVLCAHLWRKLSEAQVLHGAGRDERASFCNVVNMRGRMEPRLAAGYFGCVLLWGMASTTLGELEDEELVDTAARIRAAVRDCTNSHMQQFIHFLEIYGKDAFAPKIAANTLRMRVSSSPKFPALETDFGWGRPLAVRSAIVEENGKVVLYPGPSGLGSADVCLSLPHHIMSTLKNDPSFHPVLDRTLLLNPKFKGNLEI